MDLRLGTSNRQLEMPDPFESYDVQLLRRYAAAQARMTLWLKMKDLSEGNTNT